MEGNTLNFERTNNLLKQFIDDFMNTYKSLLIKDGKNASGNLIKSLKNYSIRFEYDSIVGEIEIAPYWKYVEYGRKPGKFPPPQAILSWVESKSLPRPVSGLKQQTKEQFAYLVARKIAREGIQPGNQFQEALRLAWTRWEGPISDAISLDILSALN